MNIKLGSIVQFRAPKLQAQPVGLDYSAIVYIIHDDGNVGLTVFFDGIPTRYGKVYYSKEPKEHCWREIE